MQAAAHLDRAQPPRSSAFQRKQHGGGRLSAADTMSAKATARGSTPTSLQQRRRLYILTEAGKPIWASTGESEAALAPLMGLATAVVGFAESSSTLDAWTDLRCRQDKQLRRRLQHARPGSRDKGRSGGGENQKGGAADDGEYDDDGFSDTAASAEAMMMPAPRRDRVRCVVAGRSRMVFLNRGAVLLLAVSHLLDDTESFLALLLESLYHQILFTLTAGVQKTVRV